MTLCRGWCCTLKMAMWYFEEGGMGIIHDFCGVYLPYIIYYLFLTPDFNLFNVFLMRVELTGFICHRDLKTQNIFLCSGGPGSVYETVNLGDFGISKGLDSTLAFSKVCYLWL